MTLRPNPLRRCVRSVSVGFGCGWCDTNQAQGEGNPQEQEQGLAAQSCSTALTCQAGYVGTFSTQLNDCPRPTVTSFSPAGGPVYGARISIKNYTRGVPLSFTPLLHLKVFICVRPMAFLSVVRSPSPVGIVNSIQTLKVRWDRGGASGIKSRPVDG
jgi:hypothetical protein